MLFEAPPNRTIERRTASGAMEQQAIERISFQRFERIGDAFVYGRTYRIARRIGGKIGQRRELGCRVHLAPLKCVAQPLFGIAVVTRRERVYRRGRND